MVGIPVPEESQLSPVGQLCSHLVPTGYTSCGRSATNASLISADSSDYTRKHQPMPCLGHSMAASEVPTNRRLAGVKLKNRCLCYGHPMYTTCSQHGHHLLTADSRHVQNMGTTRSRHVQLLLEGSTPSKGRFDI